MIDYLSAMFCTYKRKEKCWKISTEKSLASHFNSPRLDPNPRPGTSPRSHSLRCRRLSPHRAASAFQSSVPSLSPPPRRLSPPTAPPPSSVATSTRGSTDPNLGSGGGGRQWAVAGSGRMHPPPTSGASGGSLRIRRPRPRKRQVVVVGLSGDGGQRIRWRRPRECWIRRPR